MEKLPKELFEEGAFMVQREYNFIDLNGEEASIKLGFRDRLSEIRCPIDGANIIIYKGDPHNISKLFYEDYKEDLHYVAECPACKEQFDLSNFNEESNLRYLKSFLIPKKKIIINQLKENLNKLERVLKLAENSNNIIKKANLKNEAYNKANLSELKQENPSKVRDIADKYIKNLKKGPKTH